MVSVETGETWKLTEPNPRFVDTNPAVSADGRTVVFTRSHEESRGDLYQLALSEKMGSQPKPERLTFANPWNGSAAWIAHQPEIVLLSGNVYGALNLCRLAPSTPAKIQRLASAGDALGRPAVSRQGNRLAYSVPSGGGGNHIWQVEVQNNKAKQAMKLIASTRTEMEPAYSPDGRKIAFASWRSGSLEIWVCESDGSHPVQLTSLKGSPTNRPRWSPDGQLITFVSEAKGNRDIYVIRADGGVPKQVRADPSTDSNPNWSADGKWIYFFSDRSRQKEIWKVPVGGGEAVRVSQIRGGDSGQAVESPDGKFLYYEKGWPDNYAFWRVPINGGEETLVVDSLHPEGGQVVANDGVYFISKPDEKGVSYIRFKDFATGSIRTIVPIEGRVHWGLSVSPDRHSFLYTQIDESGSDLMLVENFH
jgi:Tol biopolymer transport system component